MLGTAVAEQRMGNPLTDLNLINSVKSDLTFDQSWSVDNMASLVLDFHSVGVNSVPQLTLPVAVVTDPDGAGGSYVSEEKVTGTLSSRPSHRTRPRSTRYSVSVPPPTP